MPVALLVAAVVLVGACSDDADDTDEAATTTTATVATTTTTAAEATTTTISDVSSSPPEAGEPNTVNIVFEDGETGTAPVFCDSDPDEDFFEFSVRSGPDERPRFELLFFSTGEKVAEWRTEDEIWLVSPTEGSIDVVEDPPSQSPISGTGVFLEADLTEEGEADFTTGQPLTTGEERAAAFTIVCADFSGGPLSPLTTGG